MLITTSPVYSYRIRPRFLRDVTRRDLSCDVLGCKFKMPVGICPTAMQKLAHPDGELANARAAGEAGIVFILSTISTCSIEEVAKAAPKTNKWFQLYIYKDRKITMDLIRRAEKCDYKAIVLTVDAPLFGLRLADIKNRFQLPSHLRYANFEDGEKSNSAEASVEMSGLNKYVTNQFDQTLNWDDVRWLVNFTKLPVVIKGILTREDAILSIKYGCKGIMVSNHGARQLDSVPATIEVLPEIVAAVGNKCVVMLDGGVTQGTDVFKALALGAKAVFIGRPALWGLTVDGQTGVENVLNLLRNEFDIAMALTGCKGIDKIDRTMVVHKSYYCKL